MIEVKAVGGIIFEQNLRGTAPQLLDELLTKYSREDIAGMSYEKDEDGFEAVTIRYKNGYEKSRNVTGDSVIGILSDVYKALI